MASMEAEEAPSERITLQALRQPTKSNIGRKRISVGGKLYEDEIPLLTTRLKLFGYDKEIDLLRDFMNGKFPPIHDDPLRQSTPNPNQQANGSLTGVAPTMFNMDWIKKVDRQDMLTYYEKNRKYSIKYSKCLVSYFKDYAEVFFGGDPEKINSMTPAKRSWILAAFRNFGLYYLYKTGQDTAEVEVVKIIKRYQLNRGLDRGSKMLLYRDDFVQNQIEALKPLRDNQTITTDLAFTIWLGLFTGLREEEIVYIYDKETCYDSTHITVQYQQVGKAECKKLHVMPLKESNVTALVLNWFRQHKRAYLTLLPTPYFERLRLMPSFSKKEQIDPAHWFLKSKFQGLQYITLRKLHYNVMYKGMGEHDAELLAGRAKNVSAKHYMIHSMEDLGKRYVEAWKMFGVMI